MSTVITTVLITAPLAFMVGWLVSKALFRYLSYAALPLAHQFRQQRMIISELRGELRLRDLQQQELDAAKTRGLELKAGETCRVCATRIPH